MLEFAHEPTQNKQTKHNKMQKQQDLFTLGARLQNEFDCEVYSEFKSLQLNHEPPSLSERVMKMLSVNHDNIDHSVSYVLPNLTLDWSKLLKKKDYLCLLSQPVTEERPARSRDEELKLITKAAFDLKPYVDSVHQSVHELLLTLDIDAPDVQAMVTYFPHKELLTEIFRLYRSGEYLLSFALGITLFERAIGDLLLHSKSDYVLDPLNETTMREMRINEILINPEIETFLGEDVVFVIRCFTGPIQSMNLRNLLWHGFLGLNEFQPCFTSFLLVLIFSVGSLERVKGRENFRESLDMTEFMSEASHLIPEVSFQKEHVKDILKHSYFISQTRIGDWEKSVDLFFDGQYYHSIAMALPLLEHSMRRLFGQVNNCPERIHCAETDIMYTTFDEILDPLMEDGTANKLYQELPHDLLFALFDFLFWKDGPRIRDKIAHGILDPTKIPKCIPQMILNSALYLCLKYTVFPPEEKPTIPYHDLYSDWYSHMTNYETIFHPAKMLFRDMQEIHQMWRTFSAEYLLQRKSTERVQQELDKIPLKMLDDMEQCRLAIQSTHHQITSFHSSNVLIVEVEENQEQLVTYATISKRPSIPPRFIGKVGNCSSTGLSAIYVLRKTVFHVKEFLQHIQTTYTEYMELINQRKGQKKHRLVVAKLLYNMDDFSALVQLVMAQVQLLFLESFNEAREEQVVSRSEDFRHSCLGLIISLLSSVHTNRWDKIKRSLPTYLNESINYKTG